MNARLLISLLFFANFVFTANAAYLKHGTNHVASPQWPVGLADIANDRARISGHSLNWTSEFQFSGGTATVNRLLDKYASIAGFAHIVYLVPATGNPFYGGDLELQILAHDQLSATLKVLVNGRVKLKELTVPQSVAVELLPQSMQPLQPSQAQAKALNDDKAAIEACIKAHLAEQH